MIHVYPITSSPATQEAPQTPSTCEKSIGKRTLEKGIAVVKGISSMALKCIGSAFAYSIVRGVYTKGDSFKALYTCLFDPKKLLPIDYFNIEKKLFNILLLDLTQQDNFLNKAYRSITEMQFPNHCSSLIQNIFIHIAMMRTIAFCEKTIVKKINPKIESITAKIIPTCLSRKIGKVATISLLLTFRIGALIRVYKLTDFNPIFNPMFKIINDSYYFIKGAFSNFPENSFTIPESFNPSAVIGSRRPFQEYLRQTSILLGKQYTKSNFIIDGIKEFVVFPAIFEEIAFRYVIQDLMLKKCVHKVLAKFAPTYAAFTNHKIYTLFRIAVSSYAFSLMHYSNYGMLEDEYVDNQINETFIMGFVFGVLKEFGLAYAIGAHAMTNLTAALLPNLIPITTIDEI